MAEVLKSRFDNKDISIYISFPFCNQKCHFCDWVQRVPKKDLLRKPGDSVREKYVQALCLEIRERGAKLTQNGYRPKIIYWGGGTSTTMTFEEVGAVMSALSDAFDLSHVTEWTIEGSPDTISKEALLLYREYNFNRFSFGMQSFSDERLRKLGRRHNVEHGLKVFENARAAGFDNISIDLMCGFAGETLDEVLDNVKAGVALEPEHISLYTFRPTEGTVMRRAVDKKQVELDVTRQLKSYKVGRDFLVSAGYAEYGVGYFGPPAENVIGMFQMKCDVVGFGSGAVSIFEQRYYGHTSGLLHKYIESPTTPDFEQGLISAGVALSTLRSGLSIFGGIKNSDWVARTGESLHTCLERPEFKHLIDLLDSTGSLELSDDGIMLNEEKAALITIGLMNSAMMASSKVST